MSASSQTPAATPTREALTPERLAEIKDLLHYESSISFHSHRAKESMLLLVAEVEHLWADRTPQAPSRRPVDPGSKAARLARLIAEKYPKDAVTEPVDGETLTVYVTPAALGDWDWWLGRFHVQPGAVTHRGSYATAKGNHGSVQVLLTGAGVPALYAAERAAQTGGVL